MRWHKLIREVGVVVALVAATTTAVAKARREERLTSKTFHACPRGVCAETEAKRFVDLDNADLLNPTFVIDPAGESRLTNLELDTTQNRNGRLVISAPGDQSFSCDRCIHRPEVDRTIVQLRIDKPPEACTGPRQAIRDIKIDGSVECVGIVDRTFTGPE